MNGRALCRSAAAAPGGWAHLADQARTDWWLLGPIIVAFGAQVALDTDVAAAAELTVDSNTWTDPAWDGDGPGGHHRSGTLRFTASGPVSATLTIGGLDQPVTARWTLLEGG